jgi:hypothetical protein
MINTIVDCLSISFSSVGDCNREGKQRINFWSKRNTESRTANDMVITHEKNLHSQGLKIGEVAYVWGEHAREALVWGLPAKQSNNHRTPVRTQAKKLYGWWYR